jgi:hypothetical protein
MGYAGQDPDRNPNFFLAAHMSSATADPSASRGGLVSAAIGE